MTTGVLEWTTTEPRKTGGRPMLAARLSERNCCCAPTVTRNGGAATEPLALSASISTVIGALLGLETAKRDMGFAGVAAPAAPAPPLTASAVAGASAAAAVVSDSVAAPATAENDDTCRRIGENALPSALI